MCISGAPLGKDSSVRRTDVPGFLVDLSVQANPSRAPRLGSPAIGSPTPGLGNRPPFLITSVCHGGPAMQRLTLATILATARANGLQRDGVLLPGTSEMWDQDWEQMFPEGTHPGCSIEKASDRRPSPD